MPIKRPQLINGEIYHIVMRGIEGRIIFPQEVDYLRFIHNLFEFNDETPIISTYRKQEFNRLGSDPVLLRKKRKLLVEIFSFCLMPNHFHLLLRQLVDKGISRFMQKLNSGYATYINKKYQRQGHLFQGRFRAVQIKDEEQLKNGFVYISANPTELIEPDWKEKGIKDPKKVIKFLENYRWSSYSDYFGKKNFPSITSRDFITKILGGPGDCRKFLESWILYKAEVKKLGSIILE